MIKANGKAKEKQKQLLNKFAGEIKFKDILKRSVKPAVAADNGKVFDRKSHYSTDKAKTIEKSFKQ